MLNICKTSHLDVFQPSRPPPRPRHRLHPGCEERALLLRRHLAVLGSLVAIQDEGVVGLVVEGHAADFAVVSLECMVKETYAYLSSAPHMALFPCAAISSLVVGFNLLADGLREISLRD